MLTASTTNEQCSESTMHRPLSSLWQPAQRGPVEFEAMF